MEDFNGWLSYYSDRPTLYEHIGYCTALTCYTMYKVNAGKKGVVPFDEFIPSYMNPKKQQQKQDESDPMQYFYNIVTKNKETFKNG